MPISGLLVANVDMKAAFTPIALFYIWPTPTKEWNFASSVSFPLPWLEVTADFSLGPFAVRKKESMFGLFDLVFTPIVASHHFSQNDHLALSFTFWAPTGSYQKGRLVNLSQNTWTFIPGVAYTKIIPQGNIELTGIWQMEFVRRITQRVFRTAFCPTWKGWRSNDSRTASASASSKAGFSRLRRSRHCGETRSTVLSGGLSAWPHRHPH